MRAVYTALSQLHRTPNYRRPPTRSKGRSVDSEGSLTAAVLLGWTSAPWGHT